MRAFVLAAALMVSFFMYAPSALAGNIGDSCNYMINGDSQCNVGSGIYCTSYTCQLVADPTTSCSDSDANNLGTLGQISARYRDYDGAFRTATGIGDDCLNVNQFVESCSGSQCKVREATCSPSGIFPYAFNEYPCLACSNGACTQLP